MHELGITRNIVAIVSEHAAERAVKRVVLEVGQLSDILPEAIEFCFDVCAKGTVVEGAVLEIVRPRGRARCADCGNDMTLNEPYGICDACGSIALNITGGQELSVKSMEI